MSNTKLDKTIRMSNQQNVLKEMLRGFVPLEDFAAQLNLSFFQKLKVKAYIWVIGFYRILILPFKQKKLRKLKEDLEQLRNLKLKVKRTHLKAGEGNYYLSEQEIRNFEREGIMGPFPVILSLKG